MENDNKEGRIHKEVETYDNGQLVKTAMMKLKKIKTFSDDIDIYESEDGRAVVYFQKKDKYILISIKMI